MGTGLLWFVGGVCFVTFGVALRFALQKMEDGEYRSSSRWFFLNFMPLGVIALLWALNGDAPIMAKNIILGLIGATIGASDSFTPAMLLVTQKGSRNLR
jgi:hypothetical protein